MGYSPNLFWDADLEQLDFDANKKYVIQRVLERGAFTDLQIAFKYYGANVIIEIARNLRTLEPRALSFIARIANLPKESFKCYTAKQSSQAPWIY